MFWMSAIEYYENETIEYYENDEYKNDNDIVNEFALVTKSNFAIMKSKNDFVATHFVISSTVSYVCRKCYLNFSFNNKLYRHVRECRKQLQLVDTSSNFVHILSIVKSTTTFSKQIDYVFRFWRYITVQINHTTNDIAKNICVDTNCIMSLVDRNYFRRVLSNYDARICMIVQNIQIKKIDVIELHDISKYIELNFYIVDKRQNDFKIVVHFEREIHLVDDLKINIFVDINILTFEFMILNLKHRLLIIVNCNMTISLSMTFREQRVDKILWTIVVVIVSFHSCVIVSIKLRDNALLIDRDYSFCFKSNQMLKQKNDFFVIIIDFNSMTIQIRNVNNQSYRISRNLKIDNFRDFEKKDCYAINVDDNHLATMFFISWTKRFRQLVVIDLIIFVDVVDIVKFELSNVASLQMSFVLSFDDVIEIVMFNDITIYDDKSVYARLFIVTKTYSKIWRDIENIMNIFEKDWMIIFIDVDVKSKIVKVYSLSSKNKTIVDKKFDKLHVDEKLKWTFKSTSYEFSVFVIWRIVHSSNKSIEKKERVVIDIRTLNKISKFDVYFMRFQQNIISIIVDSSYISIMNDVNFFHQWRVQQSNRHKLTIVNHRDSEQWNVVVMNYRNSSTYVQRQIDKLLRDYLFAREYVNDIVVFFSSLEKHLRHLNEIFALFKRYNIVIKSFKTYLDYSTVQLLDQKIDSLDMTIVKNKIETIVVLSFSHILKHLEIYLEKIDYLRSYVTYYA